MNLKQLRIFQAVMIAGTTTHAATHTGYSQPTVSATIKEMEAALGLQLFRRTKGRLEPTSEAFALLTEVEFALSGLDRIDQLAEDLRQANHGRLTILSYPGIAWRFLPDLMADFRATRPQVTFKLWSRSSDTLRQALHTHRFDLTIVEGAATAMNFQRESYSFTCLVALSSMHRLASKDKLTPEDLHAEEWATLFTEHMTNRQLEEAFTAANIPLRIGLECEFFATAANFVRSQGGVAIIDPITATSIGTDGIVYQRFHPEIKYVVSVLSDESTASALIGRQFSAFLDARLRSLMQQGRAL